MENISNSNRSVTLSFKTTQEEKTALQQIALEKGISRSELMASIISAFKYNYDYIGKTSPREAELQSKLAEVNKQNRKLILALENAENRIELEQNSNRKFAKEQFGFNNRIYDLQENLKKANSEIDTMKASMNVNEPVPEDNNDSMVLMGSIGSLVLTGLTLLFMPVVFKR